MTESVSAGRVVVVGLGPAGTDLLLPIARAALERVPVRFVRTEHHPAVAQLRDEGVTFRSFDDAYEAADDTEAVYDAIVDVLLSAAAAEGEVLYAVPGNPAVSEQSVRGLRAAAADAGVAVAVIPGLSFAELAWTRLGVDPSHGARVVDGHDFAVSGADVSGPMLIMHAHRASVLSDVKLALLDALDPETPVRVLQRLGLPDEVVSTVPLAELDRGVMPDHLTSLFVDTTGRAPAQEIVALLELAWKLRNPGGCPWDAEQTHHSLTRYLLEEAYEVVEAVEALPIDAPTGLYGEIPEPYDALQDELGDLLYQVVFHAILAQEAGAFTMGDVARGIHDKLVRRHPHVFGTVEAETSDAVISNWEQIKKAEKGTASVVDDITPGLPSLLYVHKLYRKASSIGIDPQTEQVQARLEAAVTALPGVSDENAADALGELLAAAVVFARAHGIDAESALRTWGARFREEVRAREEQR